MALTGYARTDAPADAKFQFNPFVPGAKFRISGYCFLGQVIGENEDGTPKFLKNDNDDIVRLPALSTTIGDDVRLTEFYRPVMTADNIALEKDTQFAKDLIDTLIANRGKATEEVLQAVVDKFKDKELIVKSVKPYKGVAKDGSSYTGSFRIYDYA